MTAARVDPALASCVPGWMGRPLLFAVVLAACTSAEPRPEPVAAPLPRAVEHHPPGPAEPHAASHWYWDLSTAIVDAKSIPSGWQLRGDSPLHLQLFAAGVASIDVVVPGSEHHDTGVVAVDGDAVYVAHHSGIATGTTLTRFDLRGNVEWSTPLRGVGPTSHSKYRNEVQIAVENGNPVVFGHESHGDYTEVVDAKTGKTIAHGEPPQVLTTVEWSFADRVPVGSPVTLVAGDHTFEFREAQAHGEQAELVHFVDGALRWSKRLPGADFCGRAAMHELFGTLWLVRYCGIATGAEVLGIEVATGETRVERSLRALPDIGHSEYFAEVQLRDIGGYLVVVGNEAGGRYFEAIHPLTGETIVSRTWK